MSQVETAVPIQAAQEAEQRLHTLHSRACDIKITAALAWDLVVNGDGVPAHLHDGTSRWEALDVLLADINEKLEGLADDMEGGAGGVFVPQSEIDRHAQAAYRAIDEDKRQMISSTLHEVAESLNQRAETVETNKRLGVALRCDEANWMRAQAQSLEQAAHIIDMAGMKDGDDSEVEDDRAVAS